MDTFVHTYRYACEFGGVHVNTLLHVNSQVLIVTNSLAIEYHKEMRDKDRENMGTTMKARQVDSLHYRVIEKTFSYQYQIHYTDTGNSNGENILCVYVPTLSVAYLTYNQHAILKKKYKLDQALKPWMYCRSHLSIMVEGLGS